MTKIKKHMKYLLSGGVFLSLKFGMSSFDLSLFTDTELDTFEPDLTLMTQITERQNTEVTKEVFQFILRILMHQMIIIYNIAVHFILL